MLTGDRRPIVTSLARTERTPRQDVWTVRRGSRRRRDPAVAQVSAMRTTRRADEMNDLIVAGALLAILIGLAIAAPIWGYDSRDGTESN
jgi:hypothetical protein